MNSMKIGIYAALVALVAAAVVLVPTRTLRAQSSTDIVAAITQLENSGVQADLAGDQSWYQKNLADDFMDCDSSGTWYTRADLLKMGADPASNKFNSEAISNLNVRVYGDTAIATYSDTYDAIVNGEHRARTILATDVWVMIGADWKLVNSQGTTAK
jgi:hypothetical protein